MSGRLPWLQRVLAAEQASRGRPRTIVISEAPAREAAASADPFEPRFDVVFSPMTDAGTTADLSSASAIDALPEEGAAGAAFGPEAAWIETTAAIFRRWAYAGEDPADHAVLDAVRAALAEAGAGRDDLLTERLVAAEAALASARRSLADLAAAADAQAARDIEMTARFNERTHELVRARRRPIRNLRRYLELKLLQALSSGVLPLPRRTRARFAQSAAKRDPKQYRAESLAPVAARPDAGDDVVVLRGALPHHADRPVVVVVSHEASRSGAPILALNLARSYAERYTVVAMCLRGGDLVADFQAACSTLYVTRQPGDAAERLALMLDALCRATPPLFAVVNCIESRGLIRAFDARGVPTVGLFHEFASNILPKTAFAEAFRSADEIVFSTELTIANALEHTCSVRTGRFHVLPQGRCALPHATTAEATRQKERDRLSALLQPNGPDAGEFLVLGAGYVQMRKGVDLFIDVARRVLSSPKGRSARFAWIGPLYDPERDAGYSVYLKDQIERAGLADRMIMVSETSEIDHAYALSQVLLLTSRLDPLPNVAIDAMSEGLPVICFDKTTGIADLLVEAGLGSTCVADYLDTAQAAEKLLELIASPARYRAVSETTRAYAAVRFDREAYARRIEDLALSVRAARDGLEADRATIAAAPAFDPAFMLPAHEIASTVDAAARFYLTGNTREPAPRRPEPGFNPLAFADAMAQDRRGGDAYAEFLRRGRPAGPWLQRVISSADPMPEAASPAPLRTALHIHAYYPDVIPAIAERIAVNRHQPDLFVSAADEASLDRAVEWLAGYRGRIAEARVTPNRGRDLGPLLTAFGPALVRDYDLIGHVHTKKSPAIGDRAMVERWVRFLSENMLGGSEGGAMMDRIIAAFAGDERLGLVFPSDPNVVGWSANAPIADRLAERLQVGALPVHFDFPVGSMFWVRTEGLEPFVALRLNWSEYPVEPAAYDGTILHAIERLFGIVAESRGLNVAVSHVTGVTR